jgi:hypothetical protein
VEGWRLIGSSYVPLEPNERGWLWSEELGLWLGTWVGQYNWMPATWLRMYTAAGTLVPVQAEAEYERAEAEHQRAAAERQRAEGLEQEVARLRTLLQQQPPQKNGGQSK